ncbi:Piwi-domain-containing protein [Wolfiporia cocos MD-104 SS10]|uniref:Piwi-domain-containing protein n=1 Tax=Wolfiporia cocos (strain MD-104) TaxID=742152 RepID=A0A2H3J8K9_WOLCO|nr:Piwi-domain-containing protein [Wolfiporia cocos MD-104 SS10]
MAVNLLQIIVRQAANQRHGFPLDAKSFFTNRHSIQLGGGLEAWRGFFQSVRPVLNRLLINIDIAHALIYHHGPLVDVAINFLGDNSMRTLTNLREGSTEFVRLRNFFKKVNIKIKVGPSERNNRARPIKDLVLNAGRYEFEKDGSTTTVYLHYRDKYNYTVKYPDLFGVRIGSGAIFPAEICEVVPGQLYRKKIPQQLAPKFVKYTAQKPDQRLRAIQEGVAGPQQVFDYDRSDFMIDAGVEVRPEPIQIQGRVLNTPQIKYGSSVLSIRPRSGSWNVLNQRFLKPVQIRLWAVVNFDQHANESLIRQFVDVLARNLHKLGQSSVLSLMNAGRAVFEQHKNAPSFLLIFLPMSAAEPKRRIKRFGDTENGVATQCVRQGKWERLNDQYCNNIALKINAKLGGENSATANQILPAGFMVVGMDVGHPGPGVMNRPSVTSLVASLNFSATIYSAHSSVQKPRVEIISDLKGMLTAALRDFGVSNNGNYPRGIIFYRDGVSEGEYAHVAEEEITAIKETFRDLRALDPRTRDFNDQPAQFHQNQYPRITFIVVGKRHHIRFFPSTSSGNCPPGFVVDDQITNATFPDFYLQSHSGIQGTSRPSHYIVLQNEIGLTPDQYQEVSFALCHVYASATRSVSIPAPVYFLIQNTDADRVCARAENHFDEALHFAESDAATTTSGGSADFPLEKWREGYRQVHRSMRRQMYFL